MLEKLGLGVFFVLASLSCAAAFVIILQGMPGAEGSNLGDKRYKIEVVLKARSNPPDFWRIVEMGITKASEEFLVDCTVAGPVSEIDVQGQIELVNQAIARRPDALILAAGDYTLLVPSCEAAADAGIPVIILDSDLDTQKRVCFVGTNNYELGQKLGLMVEMQIGTSGRFGVVGHVENTATAIERKNGLLDGVSNSEQRLAALAYCNSSVETAKEQAAAMLQKYPDIKCLVGLNESSALGISKAITELGLAGEIVVVSCDSSEELIRFMENGTIQAFVIQNPYNMGYLSVKAAAQTLEGKKVEKVVNTGSIVITKEDMYKTENQKLLFPFTEK